MITTTMIVHTDIPTFETDLQANRPTYQLTRVAYHETLKKRNLSIFSVYGCGDRKYSRGMQSGFNDNALYSKRERESEGETKRRKI